MDDVRPDLSIAARQQWRHHVETKVRPVSDQIHGQIVSLEQQYPGGGWDEVRRGADKMNATAETLMRGIDDAIAGGRRAENMIPMYRQMQEQTAHVGQLISEASGPSEAKLALTTGPNSIWGTVSSLSRKAVGDVLGLED